MIPQETRDKIMRIEDAMRSGPQIDWGLENFHTFAFGTYSRGGFIPAGLCCTGKIHRQASAFVLAKGEMLILADGAEAIHIKAPYACTSEPGVKRCVYAITDCVVIDIAETEVTTVEAAEATLVCDTFEQLAAPPALYKLEDK